MKRFLILVAVVVLVISLSSCSSPERLLNFPFDPAGRSLNSPASELMPHLASRYVVFVSDRDGSQDIYLFDATERRLINLPGLNQLDAIASHPTISEDGRSIVFAASRQGESHIYLYDRETRQLRNLTENLRAEVKNPIISADGSTIAFESSANGQWDILIYSRSGQLLDIPMAPQ
ncbi:MAG: PD40 domain-containing protein [Kastovskya adunca ATA6-11-RM4]|nr:PD40 domain-containing protein [Kastovskya adunca ATA6-11-RM4]